MKQILINWAPFIVLIIVSIFFMKAHSQNSQDQKKQMDDYINKSLDQIERLTIAVEKIAEKIDRKS